MKKTKKYSILDRTDLSESVRKQFQESIAYLKSTEGQIRAPRKFELAITSYVEERTHELFEKHPKTSLPNVISTVIRGLNPHTPPELLVKLVQIAINMWQDLQQGKFADEEESVETESVENIDLEEQILELDKAEMLEFA